jgi:hypothetical protein
VGVTIGARQSYIALCEGPSALILGLEIKVSMGIKVSGGDQGPPGPLELSVIPARRTRSIVAETRYRPPGKRTLATGGEVIFMPFVLYEKSRTEYTGVHESD